MARVVARGAEAVPMDMQATWSQLVPLLVVLAVLIACGLLYNRDSENEDRE